MANVVDISLSLGGSYHHNTPEGVQNVQLAFECIKDYPGGAGQVVNAVHMRLHHGTHVDAPMHFLQGGPSISQLPLETFYGPATIIDLTFVDRGAPILPDDIERALGGRPVEDGRLMLRTDWNHHYGQAGYEEGSPYISVAAVDWITARKPLLVSYDYSHGKNDPEAPSPYYAVGTFLRNGIATMGYVRGLDGVDETRPVTVVALPLAFQEVEASPVRAALIQDL